VAIWRWRRLLSQQALRPVAQENYSLPGWSLVTQIRGSASIFGSEAEPLDMGSQAGVWKLTDIFGSEAEPLDMGSQAGAWEPFN
jgi:hypothetical protein